MGEYAASDRSPVNRPAAVANISHHRSPPRRSLRRSRVVVFPSRLGIDVYVAGVLESAADEAVHSERALRITTNHQVWVAVASFAGSTGGGFEQAAGRSAIWLPDGTVVSRAGPEPGGIARATLN